MENNYLRFLQEVHSLLSPELYLEIGVRDGSSLSLSSCLSLGVDPAFCVTKEIRCYCKLYRMTSDEFFSEIDFFSESEGRSLGLAFIDGMHLSEYAFRDFVNTLKVSTDDTVIVFDDVIPASLEITSREQLPGAWTGDVYKVMRALLDYVPDLAVKFVDTRPSGLAVVLGGGETYRILIDNFEEIQERLKGEYYSFSSLSDLRAEFRPVPPDEGLKSIRDMVG